jgi:hypothetical protein
MSTKATIITGQKATSIVVKLHVPINKENINKVVDFLYSSGVTKFVPTMSSTHFMCNINNDDMIIAIDRMITPVIAINRIFTNVEIVAKSYFEEALKKLIIEMTDLTADDINMSDYFVTPHNSTIPQSMFDFNQFTQGSENANSGIFNSSVPRPPFQPPRPLF